MHSIIKPYLWQERCQAVGRWVGRGCRVSVGAGTGRAEGRAALPDMHAPGDWDAVLDRAIGCAGVRCSDGCIRGGPVQASRDSGGPPGVVATPKVLLDWYISQRNPLP